MTPAIIASALVVTLLAALVLFGAYVNRRESWHPPSWWHKPMADTAAKRHQLGEALTDHRHRYPEEGRRRMVDNVKRRRRK